MKSCMKIMTDIFVLDWSAKSFSQYAVWLPGEMARWSTRSIYMAKAVVWSTEQGSGKLFIESVTVTAIYWHLRAICGCKNYTLISLLQVQFTMQLPDSLIILSVQMSMTNVLTSIIVSLSRWYSVNMGLLHAYLLRVSQDHVSIVSVDWLHLLDFSRIFSANLKWMESTVR